jgi:uncharacterized protein YjbI with pentapeptide repeats
LTIGAIVSVAIVQGLAGEAAASVAAAAVGVAVLASLWEARLDGPRGRGLVILAATAGMAVAFILTIVRADESDDGGTSSTALESAERDRGRDTGTNLRFAGLEGSSLRQAELVGADLSYADLSGADLSGADLSDACLWHSNLTRAVLDGASFAGADATGVTVDAAETRDAVDFPSDEDSARSTACD